MYTFRILDDISLVVLDLSGDVSFNEFKTCLNTIYKDPAYRPNLKGIADLRKVESGLNADEAEALAEKVIAGEMSSGKWAILADSPTNTALAIFYEDSVATQHPVQVFCTIDAASTFLGVDLRRALKD